MTKQIPNYLIIILVLTACIKSEENNSCNTYMGYFNRKSDDCFYSPDFYKHPIELIEKYAGKGETHFVLSEDGYNLSIFRIPRKNPRGVILLQHPVTADARVWLAQFNESTALFFWEAGFDVWMSNNRGTYYARDHVNLTKDDKEYWNFSFHEMGIYDLPASVDYIRSKTNGSKIIFINHSMGTTSSLVYASLKPDEAAASVKFMVQISPIVIMTSIRSPGLDTAAKYVNFFDSMLRSMGIHKLLDYDNVVLNRLRPFIIKSPLQFFVNTFTNFFCGWTFYDADPKFYNMGVSQVPSAISLKCFTHLAQAAKYRSFRMFDYGSEKNLEIYNSTKPPLYPLGHVKVRQMLIYSKHDAIATSKDSALLYEALPEEVRYGQLEIEGVNHITFHLSKHRIEKVYKPILTVLTELEKES